MKTLFWDSINPATGTPYTWGDPNLRWGNPAYVLEPSDPGYTPPATSSSTPKSKLKAMKRQNYYPGRTADQVIWLQNFRNKLSTYASPLGLTLPQVTAALADADWLAYLIGTWLPAARAWSQACTETVKQGMSGTGGPLVLPVFTAPPLPDGVAARDEGALNRLFDLVNQIKQNSARTPAMLSDLRIVGSEEAAPDFDTIRPELTITLSGGVIQIGWGWQGYSKFLDQCEIHVDRSDGKGWQVLTFDTTPNYTDTQPLPAALTQWKYRAIFRVDDAQVGQWSAVTSVAVGG